jgi:N-methylhydantoinase A
VLRIGIDVGGTFTDLVAVGEEGNVTLAKAASTPADQSLGVMEGLDRLAEALGMERSIMLGQTERIVHGTTVATNALLERKGARVGLLTTEGHRDVLEMREGLKDNRYDLRQPPPEPLVSRELRFGVRERLRADGCVEMALEPNALDDAIKALREARVSSVAVCFLHAWCDGRHERLTGEALRAAMPEAHVSLSCEVLPQIKEYERVCTTVVNAYVGPALAGYLGRLETRLRDAGFAGPILIMQSHGGVATIADSARLAAGAVLSGPAGGVAAGRHAGDLLSQRDLVLFDMGGTSTDVSLVTGGRAQVASDRRLAGQRVGLQALDIVSIGAGGGSIARVDAGGVLHVGPESAGADPGPACYGKGGSDATVTDANLVLGFLDPKNFLGGRAQLDRAAAGMAVDRIAHALGVSRLDAALGIHRIVNTRMAEGIRLISVRRGVDPRRFGLLAFGGAAALHVTAIARQLELQRVVVPRLASVLSAWGMLASDLRYEVARSHIGDTSRLDADALRALYDAMEAEGRRRLAQAAFAGEVLVHRSAEMRYGEQIFEVGVDLEAIDWRAPDLLAQLAAAFHRRHEELYTYALPDQEAVLVNARVAVIGRLPALPHEPLRDSGPPAPPQSRRRIWLGDWHEAAVFDLDALRPGHIVEGPAIVESATTTALLRPGDRARATERGWLDITIAGLR